MPDFLQIGLKRIIRVNILIYGDLINRITVQWRRPLLEDPQPDMTQYCFNDLGCDMCLYG
jgi:hypothetical protein